LSHPSWGERERCSYRRDQRVVYVRRFRNLEDLLIRIDDLDGQGGYSEEIAGIEART